MSAGDRLELELSSGDYVVCRLPASDPVPEWAQGAGQPLLAVTRTGEELSIVCAAGFAPAAVRGSGPWRALRVAGTLDHSLVGVLASLAGPLAEAAVPIFAISTFDTDYLLVPAERLGEALGALSRAGHSIR